MEHSPQFDRRLSIGTTAGYYVVLTPRNDQRSSDLLMGGTVILESLVWPWLKDYEVPTIGHASKPVNWLKPPR